MAMEGNALCQSLMDKSSSMDVFTAAGLRDFGRKYGRNKKGIKNG